MADNSTPPTDKKPLGGVDLGLNLIVSVLVAGAIGYAADRYFNTLPLWMLLGGFLGFLAWLRTVWQAFNTKREE
jgi:F0F1-type ATP synthase assembly protein I